MANPLYQIAHALLAGACAVFCQILALTPYHCVFAAFHTEATILLMDLLDEESGLCTMAGKVNMDCNSPDTLREASACASVRSTKFWLKQIKGKYAYTHPILMPQVIPSCTDDLMRELHMIQQIYGLPVQSHLSENPSEIA